MRRVICALLVCGVVLAITQNVQAKKLEDVQLSGEVHWLFHTDTANHIDFTFLAGAMHVAKPANWLNIGVQADWRITKNDSLGLHFRAGVLRLQDSSTTPQYVLSYLVGRIGTGKWVLISKAGFSTGSTKKAFFAFGVDYYPEEWVYIGSKAVKTPVWGDYGQLHVGFRVYKQEAGLWYRNYFDKDYHCGVFLNIQFGSPR
ncbi:hypothetical protein ACFL0L_02105 [Patescibacteria group bacterium]